jgi:hydroxymethylpyrimidine/phosphomethylpyrimidine kinase
MGLIAAPPHRNLVAVTIAGSDSGAGAGVQADLKTFAAHGVFGATALTLITVQNTLSVQDVHLLPPGLVKAQIDALFDDFLPGAIKTGALGGPEIIDVVAACIRQHPGVPLVVDPVMISKHGHALLGIDAIAVLKKTLLPLAEVVTPNLNEAAVLSNSGRIGSRPDMLHAAEAIARLGCRAVIIKGGHMEGEPADLLWRDGAVSWLEGERVNTQQTHGTGCTFSAAIAANLVRGLALEEAAREAKNYITGALKHAQPFGKGINPVNHFWRSDPTFGAVQ